MSAAGTASRAGGGAKPKRRRIFIVALMEVEAALTDPRWSAEARALLDAAVRDACGTCGRPAVPNETVRAFTKVSFLTGDEAEGITTACAECVASGEALYRMRDRVAAEFGLVDLQPVTVLPQGGRA